MQVLVVAVFIPSEALDAEKSHHRHKDEEQYDFQKDHPDVHICAGQACDDRQYDQAHHIVDQRGGQDGVAHLGVELADFFEGFHRDGNGSGGENGADEDVLQNQIGSGLVRRVVVPAGKSCVT